MERKASLSRNENNYMCSYRFVFCTYVVLYTNKKQNIAINSLSFLFAYSIFLVNTVAF